MNEPLQPNEHTTDKTLNYAQNELTTAFLGNPKGFHQGQDEKQKSQGFKRTKHRVNKSESVRDQPRMLALS